MKRQEVPSLDSMRGWIVTCAALVGLAVGLSPLPFYTIGMFAPEMAREFGWSFAGLMAAIAVQSVATIIASPIAGAAIDRFGARPVALISLGLFGLGYMSLGLNNGSIILFYVQWAIMTVVGSGTLLMPWARGVNSWFVRRRSLALAIASSGSGLTGILIKPFAAWLILTHGWRMAFFVIGLLPILLGLPIAAWLFRERVAPAHQSAGAPAGQSADQAEAGEHPAVQPEWGLTLRQAIRMRSFWVLMISSLLIAFATTAPTPNMENILRSVGYDLTTIGRITGVFGLAVILGRIVAGWLFDRIWAPGCAFFLLILPALGCWLLSGTHVTELRAIAAVAALGAAAGFKLNLLAYLVSRYFGQRHYGKLLGWFYAVVSAGGGVGPVLFGYSFDQTGSYSLVLSIAALCIVAGALLTLLMGPYPDSTHRADAPDPSAPKRRNDQ
ncbi:MAG: MFS transporter [Sphingobium sp.]